MLKYFKFEERDMIKNLFRKKWIFAIALVLSLTIICIGEDPQIKDGWPQEIDYYHVGGNTYYIFGINEPVVSDLDNDGKSEIIIYASGNPTRLIVYEDDGDFFDGWPIEVPANLMGNEVRTPTVGDIDNNGYKEIIVNGNEDLYIYNYNGSLLRSIPAYGLHGSFACPNAPIVLYDLDNNGTMEIIVKGECYQRINSSYQELKYYPAYNTSNNNITYYNTSREYNSSLERYTQVSIFDYLGNLLPGWPQLIECEWYICSFASAPAVGNFDDDQEKEIVVITMRDVDQLCKGKVYVYNLNGTILNGFPRDIDGMVFASPSVGDVNHDGYDEIVIGTSKAFQPEFNSGLYVIDRFGNDIDNWPQLVGKTTYASPALADFDQDGYLEIVQGIGHLSTGDYATYVFDYLGNVLNGWPKNTSNYNTRSSVIGDINNDKILDIITTINDKIHAWNFDGEPIDGFPISWRGLPSAATIADIDSDGMIDLIDGSDFPPDLKGYICAWELFTIFDSQTMEWPMFHHDAQHSGLYQDITSPKITNVTNSPDIIGFGFNVTISADVTDVLSSVDMVKVNITYPNNSYGNFIMDNIGNDTYEYIFSTWLIGQYNYTIWAIDNASNSNYSSEYNFTVSHLFGYTELGESCQVVENRITGSVFTVNECGFANNITRIHPGYEPVIKPPGYPLMKCMIFRANDSKLIGTTEEKGLASVYNFSDPKPILIKNVDYVLVIWGNNINARVFYDEFSSNLSRYNESEYGTPPDPANFINEDRIYSIYCSYTPDTTAPEITNVILNHSDPKDTDPDFGWENFTCNVTDNLGIDLVQLNVTYNSTTTEEYQMINIPDTDTYYYNTTFEDDGCYQYHIWAKDIEGNDATSSSSNFELPPNHDVNMDGQTGFWDLTAISLMYGEYGPYNGWVREDVDNDGYVGFWDMVQVSLYDGEYWYTCGGESGSGGGFGGNATVSVQPSSQTVEKGETFIISVYIEPDEAIIGATFNVLSYDASLIHANSVTEGNLFNNYLMFNPGNIDNENGMITDVYLITEKGKHKSGTLVDIEFTAQQELGISDLNLQGVFVANENNMPLILDINDGSVTIQ